MWFLSLLLNTFLCNISATSISLIIGFVVYKVSKFYLQVYSLPPGPFPLPLLGNILLFRSKEHWDQVIRKLEQKYGSIFTIWLGNKPSVFITDVDIARETFRNKDFSSRMNGFMVNLFTNEKYQDVIFTDFGKIWKALRRVSHSASLEYSTNDKLIYLVTDCVDSTVKLMIEKEGINKVFKPFEYISLLFMNITTSTAFGKTYALNDSEFKKIYNLFKEAFNKVGSRQVLCDFSFIFRILDRKFIIKIRKDLEWLKYIMKDKFIDHYKDYSESIERDFCDSLITSKNKALREVKDSTAYLNDDNLSMCIYDLIFAGYDTTQFTFKWMLLLICYYPEIQKKLRQEIETQIGDRIATHEDRHRCHYVMAFIMETLRLKNVGPAGLPHRSTATNKIGDYIIPKDTIVFVYQGITLSHEKYWINGHEFRPERFLENEKLVTTYSKAFIPFGVGRRMCLGEKLAMANLFLVLVRFLQLTSEYTIALGQNKRFEADVNTFVFYIPYEYEIIFKSK